MDQTLLDARAPSSQASEASAETLPLYLNEIGRVPLLTADEEVRLGQAIQTGLAAACELASDARLSTEARRRLQERADNGDRARDHLVRANLRLVVSIARRYANRGVPLVDLIQEGNIGLLRAAEKFDWQRGFRFSTYATWWIRQAISRSLAEDGRVIRVPAHLHDLLGQVARLAGQVQQSSGRVPSTAEIAEALGVTQTRVEELLRHVGPTASLDAVVGEEESSTLGDLLADPNAVDQDAWTEARLLRDTVHDALLTLSARERHVLARRFGLGNDQAASLSEIGRETGLSRERVRQIEDAAIRKLRHPSVSVRLRAFVG